MRASSNGIRSDTIYIENEQIEALSNRPPWAAAVLEQGIAGRGSGCAGATTAGCAGENMIAHVMDVGVN